MQTKLLLLLIISSLTFASCQRLQQEEAGLIQLKNAEDSLRFVLNYVEEIDEDVSNYDIRSKIYKSEKEQLEGKLRSYEKNTKLLKISDQIVTKDGTVVTDYYFDQMHQPVYIRQKTLSTEMAERGGTHAKEESMFFLNGSLFRVTEKVKKFPYAQQVDLDKVGDIDVTWRIKDKPGKTHRHIKEGALLTYFILSEKNYDDFFGE